MGGVPWFNEDRLHGELGFLSPNEVEEGYRVKHQTKVEGSKESRLLLLWDIPSNHYSFFVPSANCMPRGDNYPDREGTSAAVSV